MILTRWIFGRVEMLWLAPHVPLSLLSSQLVWVPSRGEDGVNDRHAAVPRQHVPLYFRRWELLQSNELLDVLPLQSLLHEDPEKVLEVLFIARGVPLGAIPFPAYIGCCHEADRCWNTQCNSLPLGLAKLGASGAQARRCPKGTPLVVSTSASLSGSPCFAAGKSAGEVREAVRSWRWLTCPGAQLVPTRVDMGAGSWTRADFVRSWTQRWGSFPKWPLWQGKVVIAASLLRDDVTQDFAGGKAALVSVAGVRTPWQRDEVAAPPALGAGQSQSQAPGEAAARELAWEMAVPAATLFSRAAAGGGAYAAKYIAPPKTACPLLVGQNDTTAVWPGSVEFGPSRPYRPSEPPTLRSLRSGSGFCSVTGADAGDCDAEMGFSGSWGWQDGVRTLAGCVRACWRYCRACRYVSFSTKISDCSWYRVCDMNNLGAKDNADLGLWTIEVVPPAAESAPVKGQNS